MFLTALVLVYVLEDVVDVFVKVLEPNGFAGTTKSRIQIQGTK